MELGQIAEIIIGILVSREAKTDGCYSYSLFDLKNYEMNQGEDVIIHTSRFFDKQITQPNDLIFRLVCPNKIVYVHDSKTENKLITSHFCIIRLRENMIDPVFLKWYLEYGDGQRQILFNITGSTVKKISVSDLRKIKIPKIDLATQKKLKDLMELWEREKTVLREIINKKDYLYNSIIEEVITDWERD